MILLELRNKSIAFSSAHKKKENILLTDLEKEIKILEETDASANYETILSKQNELKQIRENRLKGTLIRPRARWLEQGEKPTTFFFVI